GEESLTVAFELQADRVEQLQGVVRQAAVALDGKLEAAFAVDERLGHGANGDSWRRSAGDGDWARPLVDVYQIVTFRTSEIGKGDDTSHCPEASAVPGRAFQDRAATRGAFPDRGNDDRADRARRIGDGARRRIDAVRRRRGAGRSCPGAA